MDLNSICKRNHDSPSCNHWQRKVCGQCPIWKDQDQEPIIGNPAHKLMTTAECMRLKRELRTSFLTSNAGSNFWIFLILVFFIIFCMTLTLWLLAKAFVFSKPRQDDGGEINSQDRQLGGRSSVDKIMQKLREKCTVSTQGEGNKIKDSDDLYVPPMFWDRFPMNEFKQKKSKTKQISTSNSEVDNEADSDTSAELSDVESTETSLTEVLYESEDISEVASASEETLSSTGGASERSTDSEESTSTAMHKKLNTHNSLGQMPTYYSHPAINSTPDQSRPKKRWVNWLRRSKTADFQV